MLSVHDDISALHQMMVHALTQIITRVTLVCLLIQGRTDIEASEHGKYKHTAVHSEGLST